MSTSFLVSLSLRPANITLKGRLWKQMVEIDALERCAGHFRNGMKMGLRWLRDVVILSQPMLYFDDS
ncbi:MAG: hypothetical protein LC770_06895 [Acidobacteria bacterium]|nr:hypothetical protein [Acidobacteriota bacterium]